MVEWIIPVVAVIGGLLLGKSMSLPETGASKVIVEVVETGGVQMQAVLEPLYTAFVYILLAMSAAAVIAFVVWTFMQVFGEKKAGKEI